MQTVKPESVGMCSARLERIKPIMQGYVDRGSFAGVLTLVARRGRVAHLEVCGWQDLETRRPMAEDTLFRIFSMSKPITTTAVMMLVEQGKLRLWDPLHRYLPEFKDAQVMAPRADGGYDLVPALRPITIHHLLTHSGGLSYGFDDRSALDLLYRETVKRLDSEGEQTLENWIRGFAHAHLPLAFQPGTDFRYSFSIDVLGYIVQLVSGQLFDEFLQKNIFAPLGMADTAFWVPPEKRSRMAGVYTCAESGLKPVTSPQLDDIAQPTRKPFGGGGLVSTAGDYFRFGQMLLNGGELDGARLLGRKTVEWMLENHLPEGIHPMGEAGNGFGLGGSVLLHPGLSNRPGSPGKFGWGGAANTEWWIDPAEELNCLIMLQYMPCFTIPIVEDFAQLVYQALE